MRIGSRGLMIKKLAILIAMLIATSVWANEDEEWNNEYKSSAISQDRSHLDKVLEEEIEKS